MQISLQDFRCLGPNTEPNSGKPLEFAVIGTALYEAVQFIAR